MAATYDPTQATDGAYSLPRATVHGAKNIVAAITMNVRYLMMLEGKMDANAVDVRDTLEDIEVCAERLLAMVAGKPANDGAP